jgi:hypothetical protein
MKHPDFSIRFPESNTLAPSQDEEYCILCYDGRERKIRLHDYPQIYSMPGLYEDLFCTRLGYRSPEVIASLLVEQLLASSIDLSEITVLDMGAGNGLAGDALRKRGIRTIVGMDLFPEAAQAAQRDRPGLYRTYYVTDLLNLTQDMKLKLEAERFTCLVSTGALGFGDIPPMAFVRAYNLIADGGWVAFNIKPDFMESSDQTGFSDLLRRMDDRRILDFKVRHRYCHRRSTCGREIHYVAVIGKKQAPIPEAWTVDHLPRTGK